MTTVIASRHGASLYLAPWKPSDLDLDAVRQAAAAHGVDLFDAEALNARLECVVAAGLDPDRAGRLAAALRQQGLTVRVVNDPRIHTSARLSNAFALLFLASIVMAPLVLPALLAAINYIYIVADGFSLPIAGVPMQRPAIAERALDRLRALEDHLPSHVLDPLVARAEKLAREATTDPSGPATLALAELVEDLESEDQAQVAEEARSLRADLARARRAVRELQ